MLEVKLILQQLWKISLDYDEKIPLNLKNRWLKWIQTLKNIEKVKLPRWYGFSFKNIKNIELPVFVDASSCAYGTVSLIFVLYKNKTLNVCLLLRSQD